MKGQLVGYVRVSSIDQKTDRQLEGLELDKVFADKCSGKDAKRPQLEAMLKFVRQGDTTVVHSMDRLARNLDDLRRIVKDLTGRGIKIQFLKEGLTFTGDDSPMANLLLSIMGSFAEFERALLRERQKEGIAIAKAKGKYEGRKRSVTEDHVATIKARVAAGEKKASIARDMGISRETLYQYLRTA